MASNIYSMVEKRPGVAIPALGRRYHLANKNATLNQSTYADIRFAESFLHT
jgi:hypothetical protein